MVHRKYDGLTIQLIFGRWGGINIQFFPWFRLCIGWVVFSVHLVDIELGMIDMADKLKAIEEREDGR